VRPTLADSREDLFHRAGGALSPRGNRELQQALARLQRASGVICRPEGERKSRSFHPWPQRQLDAIVPVDRTSALVPLVPAAASSRASEPPEPYPAGV
jgi:Erythromycin esterase